nr:hypothetical protein [Paenibacillus xylanexedens]
MAKILKDFIERIDIEQDKFRKQRALLEQAADNPQLFFDKASEVISRKDSLFNIMNVYEDGQRKMDSIEFTEYIGKLLDTFFKKELGDHVSVKTSSYPSMYCVMVDNDQLIHFDPYEKYYGQRRYFTAEQRQKDYDDTLERINKETSETKSKLDDMKKAKENTFKYIVQFYVNKKNKSVFKRLFGIIKESTIYTFKMRQIKEGIDKKIEQYERQLEEQKRRKEKHIESGTGIEMLELRLQVTNVVSDLFKKYGYRHETENHKLY